MDVETARDLPAAVRAATRLARRHAHRYRVHPAPDGQWVVEPATRPAPGRPRPVTVRTARAA